jgi:tight adherence protein B
MRRLLLVACCALLAIPGAALAAAQPDTDAVVRIESIDVTAYPDVEVSVSVPGRPEGVLDGDALLLTEDGEVQAFDGRQAASADLQVILLLDTTGSMGGAPLDAAKAAARAFLDDLPEDAQVAVLSYDTEPTVVTDFSATREEHAAGVVALEAGGRTAMYDALASAVEIFPASDDDTNRAIVLLTDGEDNASTTTLEEATAQLVAQDAALHGVAYQTAFSDQAALDGMAEATGGSVKEAADSDALASVYKQLASELVSRYLLRYQSTAHGSVEVVVQLGDGADAEVARRSAELPSAPEQEVEAPPTLHIVSVDTTDHPDVELRVVAPRQLSEQELDAAAFTVRENGRERPVEAARITALDLEVVLAIDTSGSMRGRAMEAAKAAAVAFIDTMPDGTRVAVHAFDSTPRVVMDFTQDRPALVATVRELEAGGETALYDAATGVVDAFADREPSARSLVLLSDGGDTVSTADRDATVRRLADSGIAVHAIELQSAENDRAALEALAAPSDGTVTAAEDPDALAASYEAVAEDIANQYLLRYTSAAAGSTAIEVGVDAGGVSAGSSRAIDLPAASGLAAFFGSRAGLISGAALWYVALALVILALLAPRERVAQIRGTAARLAEGQTGLSELAARASLFAQRTLQRRGKERGLNTALERAGITLRSGEFAVLVGCGTIAGFAIGLLLRGLLAGLLLAALVILASRAIVSVLGSRRQAKFADQLGETLQLLAGSLRAGYSLMQAVDAVAREADSPSSEEFRRLVVEARLGRELSEALRAMDARVDSEDFGWVLQAIEINREVGGDLAEVLDTVAGTIRERNQIRRQVKALSAEGKLSAYVLMALPFGVGTMIAITNPSYLAELTQGGLLGYGLLGMAALLMTAGALWLRKIIKLVF